MEAAVKARVLFPLPGAAKLVGERVAVTPEGKPETDNDTAALKPPTAAEVIWAVAPAPGASVRLAGDALSENLGVETGPCQ